MSDALSTDLYQLTMAAGYVSTGAYATSTATFDLFVRRLPKDRGFLVASGLHEAIRYLRELRFSGEDIDFLRGLPIFQHAQAAFWDYLREMRFTGDVHAMPEGTLCFPGEPLLRVKAPIIEAQLVETYLLSVINFETLIATKAARCVIAAQGRSVVEFGLRRAHGPEAGIRASRAAYVGGVSGTSNVEAARRFGIPVLGTAAHAWTMAHASEEEAFSNYVNAFPSGATLLIDTYDTLRGARRAAAFKEQLKGVRLDSGDLLSLSQEVRKILDENGCQHAKIVASGDLNEYSISALLDQGAAIDTFGVGTELVTSRDAPALGGVYKLVEQEANGQKQYRAKFSAEKASYPAAKQVYRVRDGAGHFSRDVLALAEEAPLAQGEALLIPVFLEGKQVAESPLEEARARCQEQLSRLPSLYKLFQGPSAYPVERSSALEGLFRELKRHYVAP